MANFPTSIYSHTTLIDNVDDVLATHPNTLADEITAVQTKVGVNSSSINTSHDYFLTHASGAYRTHCFDEKTEILTHFGWKNYNSIKKGDLVCTFNKKNRLLEFQSIKNKYVYQNYKEMYSIVNENVDLLVTKDHGLISLNDSDSLCEFTAGDLFEHLLKKNKRKFILAAENSEKKGINISDDELRLIIQIVTDGSFFKRKDYDGYILKFKISKPRKIRRICFLLTKLGLCFSIRTVKKEPHQNLQPFVILISSNSIKELLKRHEIFTFLSKNKRLGRWILDCNKRQTDIVLDEYSITDGSTSGNYCLQISSAKEDEIDILQEMCSLNGYRSNKINRPTVYTLSINLNYKTSHISNKSIFKVVPYKGNVWCVSVDNGTLLVRRNGKTCITQNSHDGSNDDGSASIGPLTGLSLGNDVDVGNYEIRMKSLYLDVSTGTAPMTILSSTVISNLNADMVDGLNSSSLVQTSGDQSVAGVKTFSSFPELPTGTPSGNQAISANYLTSQLTTLVKCKAYRASSNQTINATTESKVQLNGESYDPSSLFDSSTNYRFTCNATGYYLVSCNARWDSCTDGSNYSILVRKNGSLVMRSTEAPSGTNAFSIPVTDVLYLTSGDYLELYVENGSATSRTIIYGEYDTFMTIHRLS